jgi:hypothetical protein
MANNSLVFIHRVDKFNIGDITCCPKDYFNFNLSHVTFDVQEINKIKQYLTTYKNLSVIIGGSGILYFERSELWKFLQQLKEKKKIKLFFWGIGFNKHVKIQKNEDLNKIDEKYPDFLDYADIVGVRDYNKFKRYIPCVSCMHPAFDKYKHIKIEDDVAVYEHRDFRSNNDKFQKMQNNVNDLEKVINFLVKAKTVVTSSYHGAYWAQLLNKKVVLFSVFSTKFLYLKNKVSFCFDNADLDKCIEEATVPPADMLDESRQLNIQFYNEVMKEIHNN